mmetsp:Transcript_117/g.147  ORF Transcript_117/g.147 Transcript_117/m.147 type:complete len:435 (+) Transcript_117:521-1825(+)
MFQKKLEGESGCKILIRGKGSQKEGQPPQPDEDDDQHVLIMGDTEDSVERAVEACNKIIMADEETRNMIRKEQLKVAAELNNNTYMTDNKSSVDESMLTPYGPPSPYAYLVPVPNECIGLIIGKKGETIKRLQAESGAKIQVAKKEVEETGQRYVFVEGPEDRYAEAKKLIDEVVDEWRRIHQKQEASNGDGPMNNSQFPMSNNLMQMFQKDSNLLDPTTNINPHAYNNIVPQDTSSHLSKDPAYQAAVSYQPYPGFRHPGGPQVDPNEQPPAYDGYPPNHGYPPQGGHPGHYPGYPPYQGYGHPGGQPGGQPRHGPGGYPEHRGPQPDHHGQGGRPESAGGEGQNLSNAPQSNPKENPVNHNREDEKREERQGNEDGSQKVGKEGAGSNPSDKHPLAHQYAEHYSKSLGGDYKYYYDYYMKTYSNPAQPGQQQ